MKNIGWVSRKGSVRITFALGEKRVLKVAMNSFGI